jgi:hypothetical protein
MRHSNKPGRPLGLSIAIIVSSLLFSILPIAQVLFFLSVQERFRTIEFLDTGGAIGGKISGIESINLVVPLVSGLIFLVIAMMAWRGNRKSIRLIFVLSVVVITLLMLILTIVSMSSSPSLEQGIDSSSDISNTLLRTRAVLSFLIMLYVIWYVNRGPARAFYRGYYLPDPEAPNNAQEVA